jgi:hypothetical protein
MANLLEELYHEIAFIAIIPRFSGQKSQEALDSTVFSSIFIDKSQNQCYLFESAFKRVSFLTDFSENGFKFAYFQPDHCEYARR